MYSFENVIKSLDAELKDGKLLQPQDEISEQFSDFDLNQLDKELNHDQKIEGTDYGFNTKNMLL